MLKYPGIVAAGYFTAIISLFLILSEWSAIGLSVGKNEGEQFLNFVIYEENFMAVRNKKHVRSDQCVERD